jgi:hypothetical protein
MGGAVARTHGLVMHGGCPISPVGWCIFFLLVGMPSRSLSASVSHHSAKVAWVVCPCCLHRVLVAWLQHAGQVQHVQRDSGAQKGLGVWCVLL